MEKYLILITLTVFFGMLIHGQDPPTVCPGLADKDNNCSAVNDTSCSGCDTNAKIPDPRDCRSFYICAGDGSLALSTAFTCPDGSFFSNEKRDCVKGDECTPLCDDSTGGDGSGCYYTCGASETGFVSDRYDCSTFHQCNSDNTAGLGMSCPANKPYFDGANCQDDETLCCHCQAYCNLGQTAIGDPQDCRKFHYCTEEGPPTITGTCPKGQHFDTTMEECTDQGPCVTLCTNVLDKDGCIDPFTCNEIGYFAKCQTSCVPEYFHCTQVSLDYAKPMTCASGKVFDPLILDCVTNSSCPFNQYD